MVSVFVAASPLMRIRSSLSVFSASLFVTLHDTRMSEAGAGAAVLHSGPDEADLVEGVGRIAHELAKEDLRARMA